MEHSDAVFEELFRERYRTILRYIYQRVSDRELAEDLTSEVFYRAYEKHQAGVKIGIPWLITTSRNLVGNVYQKRVTEKAHIQRVLHEELVNAGAWESDLEDFELRMVLTTLKQKDALALQLTYWDGLSAPEAARVMECTVPAFWARLSRARRALRAALKDQESQTSQPQIAKGGHIHG
ncbi:RNA polymerase sigma factor [Leucobacter salsicius]|uniref:RNA polymerase sigma factor n=1 Tax=Leucobacter salsicius TaxID=664638 RepID=UPI0018DC1118|nr:sigma-70 family RNA polymerase sigma factor [Leucobacter salsicius]